MACRSVADREAMRRAGSSSPRFYSFIDSGDPVTGDNDEDEAEGGAVVVESDFAPRYAEPPDGLFRAECTDTASVNFGQVRVVVD